MDTEAFMLAQRPAGQLAAFKVEQGWHFGMTFRTRWSEQDAFGHVNHKTHLTWFEEARNAYLAAAGHPVRDAAHAGPVLREITCGYERPLGLGQQVLVTARTDWVGSTSFGMAYAVWRDGLVARGTAVCIWYLGATGERQPVPDALRAFMESLDAARDRRQSGAASGT